MDLNLKQFNDNNQTMKNKRSLSKIMVLTTSTDFYMLHCLTWIVGYFGILCSIVVHNVAHKTSVNSLSAIFDDEARIVCKVLSQKYY